MLRGGSCSRILVVVSVLSCVLAASEPGSIADEPGKRLPTEPDEVFSVLTGGAPLVHPGENTEHRLPQAWVGAAISSDGSIRQYNFDRARIDARVVTLLPSTAEGSQRHSGLNSRFVEKLPALRTIQEMKEYAELEKVFGPSALPTTVFGFEGRNYFSAAWSVFSVRDSNTIICLEVGAYVSVDAEATDKQDAKIEKITITRCPLVRRDKL